MRSLCNIRAVAAKALRMALVFTLVFGMSLGVELAALGAAGAHAVPSLEGAIVEDFRVSEYVAPTVTGASAAEGKQIRSIEEVLSDKKQTIVPTIDTYGGTAEFAAYAAIKLADGTTRMENVTQLCDWTIPDDNPATLTVGEQAVEVKAVDSGEATITCKPSAELIAAFGPELTAMLGAAPVALPFSLEIFGQVAPYISSVVVLDENGAQIGGERVLTLDAATAGKPHGLRALVTVYDPSSGTTSTYTCTSEQGLSTLTGNTFGDLSWTAESEGASIDERGVLSLNDAKSARITCTAPSGPPSAAAPSDTVEVAVGESGGEDKGGEDMSGEGEGTGENDDEAEDEEGERTDDGTDKTDESDGSDDGQDKGEDEGHQPGTDGQEDTTPSDDDEGGIPQTAEPSGVLEVHLGYMPVPEGETACISSYISGVHGVTYITTWYESTDGGTTWTQLDNTGNNTLKKPTKAPYLGRQYRSKVDIVSGFDKLKDPEARSAYSPAATLEVTTEPIGVILLVDYVPVGQDTLFTTVVWGAETKAGELTYTWEESGDAGATWTRIDAGYLPVYSVLTETERLGHQFRVTIETSSGMKATSNTQMLAAQSTDDTVPETPSDSTPGSGTGTTPQNTAPQDTASPDASDPEPVSELHKSEPESKPQATPATPPKTLSETVDEQGSASVRLDGGKDATMKPVDSIKMGSSQDAQPREEGKTTDTAKNTTRNETEITVDPKVSEHVARQQAAKQARVNATEPGARWNPIYMRNEDPQFSSVLFDNPLAYVLLPLALACAAAGAVETTLTYRKQRTT